MARNWTANDYRRIIVCGTACLCLLIFVVGVLWLLKAGVVGPTVLGAVSGTGLLGVGGLLAQILKLTLKS